jgi:hypothetical protein
MSSMADLVAYNVDGQVTLVAEAKSKTDTSREWAIRMRRNMLAHGLLPNSPFFLLALPDKLYLWKDVGNIPELVEPTYEIDGTAFFQPYYKRAGIQVERLNNQSFELIVTSWLNEVIQSGLPQEIPAKYRQQFQESGLLEALKGGTIAIQVPA